MHAIHQHTSQAKKAINISDNWEKIPNVFTSDEVLNAYEKGKKEGLSMQESINKEMFENNFRKATKLAEELMVFMGRINVPSLAAKLRPNSLISFDIAIIVEADKYYSTKFDKVYIESHNTRIGNGSSTFNISFHFIPQTETLDFNLMISDGFSWKYEPKISKPSPKSRKA